MPLASWVFATMGSFYVHCVGRDSNRDNENEFINFIMKDLCKIQVVTLSKYMLSLTFFF